ncbi:MAG: hypothetical protein WCK51_10030 [Armatimonadota bacterium]
MRRVGSWMLGLAIISMGSAVHYPQQATTPARKLVEYGTDASIKKVNLTPVEITVEDLIALRDKSCAAMDFVKYHDIRFAPFETSVYRITGTLKSIRLDNEGDISFVVAGKTGAQAVIEIAEIAECKGSPFLKKMRDARTTLERRYHPKTETSEHSDVVTVDGIGFLGSRPKAGDKPFGETVRLMPCLKITFGKG